MQKQISQANRHGLTIFQLALVPTLYFHYWKNIKEFSVFLLFDTCHNIYSKFEFRVFISAQILIKLSKLRCISSFFFCFVLLAFAIRIYRLRWVRDEQRNTEFLKNPSRNAKTFEQKKLTKWKGREALQLFYKIQFRRSWHISLRCNHRKLLNW